MLRPRSRAISIRLSEEELIDLRRASVSTGARSVSELVRNAIYSFVKSAKKGSPPVATRTSHHAKLKSLEKRIETLANRVASFEAQGLIDDQET
jgi:hypothetical protein